MREVGSMGSVEAMRVERMVRDLPPNQRCFAM